MASKRRSKRDNLGEFLDTAKADRRANYQQRARRVLLAGELTEAEIATQFGLTKGEVSELLESFRAAGANLVQHGSRWSIDRHLAPVSESAWKIAVPASRKVRVGFIADTHLGSRHERLDVCESLYDWFAAEGVTNVYHCGNWIEGVAHFNRHELQPACHGMQEQVDYFIEHYPSRSGVTTYYVAGDDHEGWWSQREGVDIGRLLQQTAHASGRGDLVYLGYKEAFVSLELHGGKGSCRMLIDHPGGGSAYAVSYAAQKRIEAAQGGEKPAIWAFGHWHKGGYFVCRNVHALLVPCCKDLDTFGRKKGLEYVIGGVVVDITLDERGAVAEFSPRFRLFFDRGYYNQQYGMSGPLLKRKA